MFREQQGGPCTGRKKWPEVRPARRGEEWTEGTMKVMKAVKAIGVTLAFTLGEMRRLWDFAKKNDVIWLLLLKDPSTC